MGKRIICGCVVLGIVACLIGCQKSDNYELMKESKQQVLPIYEKKDAEVQGEKCALETLQDVYKSDYILEEWKIEKIGEPGGIFCNDEAVLISDKKTDCIFEVDYAGNILKEVGGTGSGEGEFISPSAITMCNEKIYVLDQGNNRIQVLDKELDYIEEIKLKNTQSTDPNYIPEVLSVNQESIYVTGVSLENPVVDKYTDGKLKEIGSNFIGSIYSCNNQIYLINSMVRYYDEANDSFGALTSCPEWLMTIKDNKLKKLCELPDGLNISSFLLTDRGIICVSCAGAAVYRLSENGKYEETITYIDGLEDEEIPQISINEKEEYFIVITSVFLHVNNNKVSENVYIQSYVYHPSSLGYCFLAAICPSPTSNISLHKSPPQFISSLCSMVFPPFFFMKHPHY